MVLVDGQVLVIEGEEGLDSEGVDLVEIEENWRKESRSDRKDSAGSEEFPLQLPGQLTAEVLVVLVVQVIADRLVRGEVVPLQVRASSPEIRANQILRNEVKLLDRLLSNGAGAGHCDARLQ